MPRSLKSRARNVTAYEKSVTENKMQSAERRKGLSKYENKEKGTHVKLASVIEI